MSKIIVSKSAVLLISIFKSHFVVYLLTIAIDLVCMFFHLPVVCTMFVMYIWSFPLFIHEIGHIVALVNFSPLTKFTIFSENYAIRLSYKNSNIDLDRLICGSGIIASGLMGTCLSFVIIFLNLHSPEVSIFLVGNLAMFVYNLFPGSGDSWVLYTQTKKIQNKKLKKMFGQLKY